MSLPADVKQALPAPTLEAIAALRARQQGPARLRQPVAIIGPGDGGERECADARAIGACLAAAGLAVICGGRGGVMRAASQGAHEAGGLAVGLLPEEDTRAANEFLTLALPTGLGEIRNTLIARSALALVAVGGGIGTLSEMAFGLKWGKPVLALHADVLPPGTQAVSDWPEAVARVLAVVQALPNVP